MNLKARNIILIILHIVAFSLLFFPMYDFVMLEQISIQQSNIRTIDRISFIALATGRFVFSEWSELFAIAICILFSVVLISLFLQATGKNIKQQNNPITLILAIVNLAAFFLYSYVLKETVSANSYGYEWREMFGFELAVQIILIVVFFITYIQVKRNNLD